MIQNRKENIIPTLEEYLKLGREINGSSMILDLSELLEITQFPELQGEDAQKLLNLTETAFDVIAWSMVSICFSFVFLSNSIIQRTSLLINLIKQKGTSTILSSSSCITKISPYREP